MASNNFKISKDKGTGNGSVTITANSTNLSGQDKKATVSITNGAKTQTVNVTQYYAPTITADGTVPALIPNSGGSYTYTINSHYDYMFGGIPDWISVKFSDGTTVVNNKKYSAGIGIKVTITVLKNIEYIVRKSTGFIFGHYKADGTPATRTVSLIFEQDAATKYYSITYDVTNGTKPSDAPTSLASGSSLSVKFTPDSGYVFASGDVTVIMAGVAKTPTYNADGTATVNISSINGNVEITAIASSAYVSVGYNLNEVTKPSDAPTKVLKGSSFSVVLTPIANHTFEGGDVTVTMGRTPYYDAVTYNKNGSATINISNVTGTLFINAFAVPEVFMITYDLENASVIGTAPTTVTKYDPLYIRIEPANTYRLVSGDVTVIMGGVLKTPKYLDDGTAEIDISSVNGNVEITAIGSQYKKATINKVQITNRLRNDVATHTEYLGVVEFDGNLITFRNNELGMGATKTVTLDTPLNIDVADNSLLSNFFRIRVYNYDGSLNSMLNPVTANINVGTDNRTQITLNDRGEYSTQVYVKSTVSGEQQLNIELVEQ